MNVTISEELLIEALSGLLAFGGEATADTCKKLSDAWANASYERFDKNNPVTLFEPRPKFIDPHDDPIGGY